MKHNKIFLLAGAIIGITVLMLMGAVIPPIASSFMQGVNQATNGADATRRLGFLTTNMTSITNGFWITNLNATTAFGSGTVPLTRLGGLTSNQLANVDASQVAGLPVTGIAAGANVTLTTNGAVVTVASAAGGGGGVTNNQYLPGIPTGNGEGLTNMPSPTKPMTLFVQTNGNDASAMPGSLLNTFSTLSGALSSSQRGDTIQIQGFNTLSGAAFVVTNRTINGRGALIETAGAPTITPADGSVFLGLCLTNSSNQTNDYFEFGILQGARANIPTGSYFQVRDMEAFGDGDVVFLTPTNYMTADWFNCRLVGRYDNFVISGPVDFREYDCVFKSIGFSAYSDFGTGAFTCNGASFQSCTNTATSCLFFGGGEAICNGVYVNQANVTLNACTIEAIVTSSRWVDSGSPVMPYGYGVTGLFFQGASNLMTLNAGTVRVSGGTNSNLVADMSVATYSTLYLNGVNFSPPTNGVCVNNSGTGNAVVVSGGNFSLANFSNPAGVTWLTPPPGTNIFGCLRLSTNSPFAITMPTGGAFLSISNYNAGMFLSGFTGKAATGWLTNIYAGIYRITATFGFDAGNTQGGDVVRLQPWTGNTSGAIQLSFGDGVMPVTVTDLFTSTTLVMDKVVYLPASTGISLQIGAENNTGVTAAIRDATLLIQKL